MNQKLLHLFLAAAALLFLAIVVRYAINFPLWDDFYALLDFVAIWQTPASTSQKWMALLEQHYEHRIPVGRLVTWAWYGVFGSVNFRGLVLLGNALFVGWVCWVSVLSSRQWKIPGWGVAAFVLFAFNLSAFEVMYWATAAWFFYAVYFFAFTAAFAFFHANRRIAWPFAMLAALLAMGSGANGMLIFIAILITAWLRGEWTGRKVQMLATLGLFVLFTLLYFLGYQRPSHQPGVVPTLLADPLGAIRFFLLISGNAFLWGWQIATAWGLVCVGLMGYLMLQRPWKQYPVLFGFLLFMFLSLLATAAGRAADGPQNALVSRYCSFSSIYSGMLVLLCTAYLPRAILRPVPALLLAFALLGYARSYWVRVPELEQHFTPIARDMQRVKEGKISGFRYGSFFDETSRARQWLQHYDSLGIFPFTFTNQENLFRKIPVVPYNGKWRIDSVNVIEDPWNFVIRLHLAADSTRSPATAPRVAWVIADSTAQSAPDPFVMMRHIPERSQPGLFCYEVALLKEFSPQLPVKQDIWITDEKQRWVMEVVPPDTERSAVSVGTGQSKIPPARSEAHARSVVRGEVPV